MLLFVKAVLWVAYVITIIFAIWCSVSNWRDGLTYDSIGKLCTIHGVMFSLIAGVLLIAFTIFAHPLG